jgi:hypothetical protein
MTCARVNTRIMCVCVCSALCVQQQPRGQAPCPVGNSVLAVSAPAGGSALPRPPPRRPAGRRPPVRHIPLSNHAPRSAAATARRTPSRRSATASSFCAPSRTCGRAPTPSAPWRASAGAARGGAGGCMALGRAPRPRGLHCGARRRRRRRRRPAVTDALRPAARLAPASPKMPAHISPSLASLRPNRPAPPQRARARDARFFRRRGLPARAHAHPVSLRLRGRRRDVPGARRGPGFRVFRAKTSMRGCLRRRSPHARAARRGRAVRRPAAHATHAHVLT